MFQKALITNIVIYIYIHIYKNKFTTSKETSSSKGV